MSLHNSPEHKRHSGNVLTLLGRGCRLLLPPVTQDDAMSCVTAVNREQETGRCSFTVVTLRANDAAKTQGIAAPRLAVRVERKEMFDSLPLTREREGRLKVSQRCGVEGHAPYPLFYSCFPVKS